MAGRSPANATTSLATTDASRTFRPATASSHASFTGSAGAPGARVSSKPGIESQTPPSSLSGRA